MTARRGACPGLSDPMPTGDGLLARLAVTRTLPLDAFAGLCSAARAHGNGIVEITSRGSIQVRGLTPTSALDFAAAIEALGVADPTGGRVITGPLAGLDPDEIFDASPLADRLRAVLIDTGLSTILAPKVSVVVDGGGAFALDAISADIRLRAEAAGKGCCLHIAIAGDGESATPIGTITPENAVGTVVELLKTLAARGPTVRARDIPALHLPLKGGRRPREAGPGGGDPAMRSVSPHPVRFAAEPIGTHRLRDGSFALGIGFAFGHSDTGTLGHLMDEARRAGAVSIRPAPGRLLLVIGIATERAQALTTAARRRGFVVAPDDPRRRVVACAGAPACAAAEIPTRALAPAIAAALPDDRQATIHISGCSKGCARPGSAALTIVGIGGKCGIVRNGCAQDTPREVVAVEDLPASVGRGAPQEVGHG